MHACNLTELLRSDPLDPAPSDEFVYHLGTHCNEYIAYVETLRERGAPFRLPPGDEFIGGAAAISRLGQQPRVVPLDEGAPGIWDGDDSRLAQTQKRDCFPVAAAERLEQACFSWLYDHAGLTSWRASIASVTACTALMMSCTACLTDRSVCSVTMTRSTCSKCGGGKLNRGRRVEGFAHRRPEGR